MENWQDNRGTYVFSSFSRSVFELGRDVPDNKIQIVHVHRKLGAGVAEQAFPIGRREKTRGVNSS